MLPASQTPSHQTRRDVDPSSAELRHATSMVENFQRLTQCKGWTDFALPVLQKRIDNLTQEILNSQELTPQEIMEKRCQRRELIAYLEQLQQLALAAQAKLTTAQTPKEATHQPIFTSDRPLDHAYIAAAGITQPLDPAALMQEAAALFNPFNNPVLNPSPSAKP